MKDPNLKELVQYRYNKANDILHEIDILLRNELWNTAVNRLYYACYYAVSALLLSDSVNAQTHAGVRQMFGMHYIKTGRINKDLGKFYTDIFDMRQTGDYEDFIDFSRNDVNELIIPAKKLIEEIGKLLKM